MEKFHIRRPLKANRGNQYYRNHNQAARNNGTYCGQEMTSYDIAWKDRADDFNGRICCKACQEARKADPNYNRG